MTTTPSSQFHSKLLLPVILLVILAAVAEAQGQQPVARQGCRDKCGNISIPFPFGMGKPGCFREGFQVVCNHSSHPPRAFLADNRTFADVDYRYRNNSQRDSRSYSRVQSPLELVSISVATGEARVYAAVSYRCSTNHNESFSRDQAMDFSDSPFAMSATRNVLIGVGSEAEAELYWSVVENANAVDSFSCRAQDDSYGAHARNGSCTGWGCCEQTLPPDKGSGKSFELSVYPVDPDRWLETNSCSYGMVVEKSWYNFSTPDRYGDKTLLKRFPRGVPLALDFAAGSASCPAEGQPPPPDYACVSGNSSCANATYTDTPSYICKCWEGYDGNPYVTDGCQGTCIHPIIRTHIQEIVLTNSLTL
jgi:hypothetical protein